MRNDRWLALSLGLWGIVALGGGFYLRAATIEMEEGDDTESTATPSVTSVPSPAEKVGPAEPAVQTQAPKAEKGKEAESLSVEAAKPVARAKISDLIGFFYFVAAGYTDDDPSKVPSVGKVVTADDGFMNYSTAKKAYIDLPNKDKVKLGDLLVVYRAKDTVPDAGTRVQNLAVVKVDDLQGHRAQVEVKSSFFPFEADDLVKPYDVEVQRWKKAQLKKPLPEKEIRCHVAGGNPGLERLKQTDFVILTAGENDGVVEGQVFQLREKTEKGFLEEPLYIPCGKAQVFYAGPRYSVAQILNNNEPIQAGFEAWYKPEPVPAKNP